MATSPTFPNGAMQHWVVVRSEAPGQFTARAVGVPDISATGSTREEALDRVKETLCGLLTTGQLVSIQLSPRHPLLDWAGRTDPNDPNEQAYLAELARAKQEDLENTL